MKLFQITTETAKTRNDFLTKGLYQSVDGLNKREIILQNSVAVKSKRQMNITYDSTESLQ